MEEYTRDDVRVEWSKEATVTLPDGRVFMTFQRNSYAMKVEFPDGYTVDLAFPISAAMYSQQFWFERAFDKAKELKEKGLHAGVVG